jgi:C4-dicarboxylate-specific signal transduction histidine kinase
MSLERENMVEAELRNSGARYPEAVLSVQANEPIHSTSGLGLGLVLVRRALEQVGGTIRLANQEDQACTTLWIPGQRR